MSGLRRIPLFTRVLGLSLTIGFLVPVVYEFTQKPAARSRIPSMERAAIVTAALACVASVLLAWRARPIDERSVANRPRTMQFGLWQLFAVTTLAAILLAVAKWLDVSWVSAGVAATAVGVLAWAILQDAEVRSRTGALLAGMFCPFVWMI